MIPQKIHYCWFGRGKRSSLIKKCIKSWRKYCPNWEIKEWNEDNFDVYSIPWTKEAYEAKKYAFVADYVRLYALYNEGGVYLDTDQEIIKPLDSFLNQRMFLGFMTSYQISAGVIGVEAKLGIIKELFHYYDGKNFIQLDGSFNQTPNTEWMTKVLVEKGLNLNDQFQILDKQITIYPRTYFCPTDTDKIENHISTNTVAIHHWAMSWRTKKARKDAQRQKRHQKKWYKLYIQFKLIPNKLGRRLIGDKLYEKLKIALKS